MDTFTTLAAHQLLSCALVLDPWVPSFLTHMVPLDAVPAVVEFMVKERPDIARGKKANPVVFAVGGAGILGNGEDYGYSVITLRINKKSGEVDMLGVSTNTPDPGPQPSAVDIRLRQSVDKAFMQGLHCFLEQCAMDNAYTYAITAVQRLPENPDHLALASCSTSNLSPLFALLRQVTEAQGTVAPFKRGAAVSFDDIIALQKLLCVTLEEVTTGIMNRQTARNTGMDPDAHPDQRPDECPDVEDK